MSVMGLYFILVVLVALWYLRREGVFETLNAITGLLLNKFLSGGK